MLFGWNAEKARKNLATHGVDFEDAKHVFIGPVLERIDEREDYGELRVNALGQVTASCCM